MKNLNIELSPQSISNPSLLALAWKKAHQYIRTTNWYADNFELDESSVNLSNLCSQWSEQLKQCNLVFTDLELIPAPKSQKWEFSEHFDEKHHSCLKWAPKIIDSEKSEPNKSPVKLRPLAHIGIKEQTIMTLLMMFLANHVESQQGDPSTDYKDVHDKNVVSYGNRLYCSYHNGKAEHNYGATNSYSKFFKDYQTFLQRPYYFANKELTEKSLDEEVFLVELDLKQFFDKIRRIELIEKIFNITDELSGSSQKNKPLNHILKLFENWGWSDHSSQTSDLCNYDTSSPNGIPQGLVAGGFLANIYLLEFDKTMAQHIGQSITSNSDQEIEIRIVDYCRYVDDIRFTVIGPTRSSNNPKPLEQIKQTLKSFLNEKLDSLQLEINDDKTKVEIYRGKSVGISKQLQDIQTKVSGPISFDEAHEQITQLESLLSVCAENTPEQNHRECLPNRLASIERNIFDVRDDTLRRFAANKISRMLNSIRHFTARETDEHHNPIAGDWDYLQERMARRLIAIWSRDPSLVLLLKKGLELFPCPKLLEPVLEQFELIFKQTCNPSDKERLLEIRKQKAVIHYLQSEIFRHSAEVIHKKDPQAVPAQANF